MITGNEPAMPFESATENNLLSGHLTGLTIRQHFAIMALQGYNANINSSDYGGKFESAVRDADALIAELNKTS